MTNRYALLRRVGRPALEAFRQLGFLAAILQGRYVPPPHSIKLRILKQCVPETPAVLFVETGTFLGDTVAEMRHRCRKVISIEVQPALYELAKRRFRRDRNVEIILGDCVTELPKVLVSITEPAVFWLDGHYSGGVTGRGVVDDPVLASLEQLKSHPVKSHTLLIDDARSFAAGQGGPDLVDILCLIRSINPGYRIKIHNDIIVACAGLS